MIASSDSSQLSATTTATTAISSNQIPNWSFKADFINVCNCDFGCPCNFNGFPTYGSCRGLNLFHMRSGNYGDNVKLDNLDVIYALLWPKAVHEGNGTMQLFITKEANEQQRQAIINIFSGRAKGEGPFAVFSPTFKYFLEPQFVDINVKIDGKKSSFSVPGGIIDVQLESFVNPVTGEEQDTKIQLPGGFVWKIADMAKTKIMRILTPNLNFDNSGQHAEYAVVEYKGSLDLFIFRIWCSS